MMGMVCTQMIGAHECPTPEPKNKHDENCLRRKEESGNLYLCTCDLTDKQLADHIAHLRGEVIGDD